MKTFDSRFTPREIFARMQGAWLEPRQGSMWQENTGVTPTTTGGQTIGLLLDQSQGAVLGPELVTNGTFDTDISGWVQASGPTHVWESGRAKGSSSFAYAIFRQTLTVTAGRTYRVSFDVERGTTAQVIAYLGNSVNDSSIHSTTITASGNNNYVVRVTPTTSTLVVHFRVAPDSEAGATKTYYVDNVSVREILGNHASQSTAANRPLLGARRNLLTYSEQFDNAIWIRSLIHTVSANATTSPDGQQTADLIIPDTTLNNLHRLTQTFSAVSGRCVYTVYVKPKNYSGILISCDPGTLEYACFDLLSGLVTLNMAVSASISNSGNSWWRITVVFNLSATTTTTTNVRIWVFDTPANVVNITAYAGDGTSGIYIWGAQLELGSVATDYQRVTTATDYDAGRFPAIRHADSTDSLSVALPAINVRRNLLTYSEQFDNAPWSKLGLGVIQNAVFCPITTRPSALIYPTLSSDACYIIQNRTTIESLHTFTVVAKRQNKNILWLYHYGGVPYGIYYVDLRDGSTLITPGSTRTGILSATHLQDGWYQISLSITAFVGSANWGIGVCDAAGNIASVTATDTDGVFLASAQLELGSVATDYQKITDWTSEAYSSSGSTYFATSAGMSSIHNQSIGTTYNLPAPQTDVYGVVVVPSRLPPITEQKLALYMQQLAGVQDGNFFWQEDYGPELITNGDFSNGTTGWSATNNSLITAQNGGLRVTYGGSAYAGVDSTRFNLTVGRQYLLTYSITEYNAGGNLYVLVSTGVAGSGIRSLTLNIPDSIGSGSTVFTAAYSYSSVNVSDGAGGMGAGGYFTIDNISIREVLDGQVGQLLADDNDTILLAQ